MNFFPILNPGIYIYTEAPQIPANAEYLCIFKEQESITLIMKEDDAIKAGLPVNFRAEWITLSLATYLTDLGITAMISSALAAAGISCNVVAALYHDHIFVPVGKGKEACSIILKL